MFYTVKGSIIHNVINFCFMKGTSNRLASTQKVDVQKSTLQNETTSRVRTFQTWTDGKPWFRHKKVDNQMYCVVCITFGIANKNHVKRPISNTWFYIWVNSLEVREHQGMSL